MSRTLKVLLLLAIPTALSAQAPPRTAVPTDAQLQAAKKLVAEVYKGEFTAAKSAAQKQALVRKLLGDAEQSKDDAAARYAMLQVARNIAAGVGDVELALRVLQKTKDQFAIDGEAAQLELLTELSAALASDADAQAFLRQARRALAAMVKGRQFEAAKKLGQLAQRVSGKARDSDLAKEWTRRNAELAWQAKMYEAAEPAEKQLATSPTDAAANATVGKYLCFAAGDWESGLPMLALGDDKALQALAERELRREGDPAKLAQGWDEVAKELPNDLRIGALRRAEKWYRVAVRSAKGLEQRRIQVRLEELLPQTTICRANEWLELLDLVDPAKHGFNSPVTREGNYVVIGDHRDQGYFTVPVSVTGGYELRVRAAWKGERDEGIGIRLPGTNGGQYFLNAYSGTASGVGQIDGKDVNGNPSTTAGVPTSKGVPYEVLVRVERKGDQRTITATVNGKRYSRWSGPVASLSGLGTIPWHPEQFGISDWWRVLEVQSLELKVLDGGAYLTE